MNLYLLDSLPPGGDYVCGEPGAKSAVGNEQLRLLWSEDRQMMLFFFFCSCLAAVLMDQIAGVSIWNIFYGLKISDGKDVIVCRLQI